LGHTQDTLKGLVKQVSDLRAIVRGFLPFISLLIRVQMMFSVMGSIPEACTKLYKRTLPTETWVPYYLKMYAIKVIDRSDFTPQHKIKFYLENRDGGRSYINAVS
jgi:hypothetical protein